MGIRYHSILSRLTEGVYLGLLMGYLRMEVGKEAGKNMEKVSYLIFSLYRCYHISETSESW